MLKARQPIKFGDVYENIDEVGLTENAAELIDCWYDEAMNINKRPGLKRFADLDLGNIPVDGMFYDFITDLVFVLAGGRFYQFDRAGTVTAQASGTPVLTPSIRPSWTLDNSNNILVAAQSRLHSHSSIGIPDFTPLADLNAPQTITSLAFIDGYILANDQNTPRMHFSELNNFAVWNPLDFISAESNPDHIVKILVNWRDIYLFGSNSIEKWYSSGNATAPFMRLEGGIIEDGTLFPDTILAVDNTILYLNRGRRLVRLEGLIPKVLSTPYDKVIAGLGEITSAKADLIEVDNRNWIILSFSGDQNLTLAYDYALNKWHRWAFWNKNSAQYERHRLDCSLFVPQWNKYLVGDRETSLIYEITSSEYTDDTKIIRSSIRFGHETHNTHLTKRSNNLSIRCKRGLDISGNLGEDILINGSFVVGSGSWVLTNGWSWAGGAIVKAPGIGHYLYQGNTPAIAGEQYLITYRIFNYTVGSWIFFMNDMPIEPASPVNRSGNGIFRDIISVQNTVGNPTAFFMKAPYLGSAFSVDWIKAQKISQAEPQLMLRYKSDNQDWSQVRNISLGQAGDANIFKQLYNLGMYRSRQYEFTHTDATPLFISSLEEDIDILGNYVNIKEESS